MPFAAKRHLPPLIALAVALAFIVAMLLRPQPTPERTAPDATPPVADSPAIPPHPGPAPEPAAPPTPADPPPPTGPSPHPALSVLASIPDWAELEAYQRTITRKDFQRLLTTIFTTGDAWRNFIMIHDEMAVLWTGLPHKDPVFLLRFAPEGETLPTPRNWQPTRQLPPAPLHRPLEGLHIAIDPGHIGGEWAQMEERWLLVGQGPPITEGDMTLLVAQLLKPELESLGAEVTLVRDSSEPVTPLRPDTLLPAAELAAADTTTTDSPAALQRFAQRLFYRTAEIRARADLVNHQIKPDLVLCLHFNAEAWGDPRRPKLMDRSHLHLLLNGGYNDEEVALADQRFAMLKKLLQRTHEEEAFVGATVAEAFAEISGLPPFTYSPDNPNVRPVNNHPYLWARNLLANRLYDCPVIFMEPYVMNSKTDYARMQAGDYDGLRSVAGQLRQSIFREYVDGMVEGLVRHYSLHRELAE
jgi:N-acetylmuramoyl-L-alanine amidase